MPELNIEGSSPAHEEVPDSPQDVPDPPEAVPAS
jgi:hypothetical protein